MPMNHSRSGNCCSGNWRFVQQECYASRDQPGVVDGNAEAAMRESCEVQAPQHLAVDSRTKTPYSSSVCTWRGEWDSNPRAASTAICFRGSSIRPLWHPPTDGEALPGIEPGLGGVGALTTHPTGAVQTPRPSIGPTTPQNHGAFPLACCLGGKPRGVSLVVLPFCTEDRVGPAQGQGCGFLPA